MNILRRCKTMFKKKRHKDPVKVEFEPRVRNDKIMLTSKCKGDGKFEVGGVTFYADSHAEALRKYSRASSHKAGK